MVKRFKLELSPKEADQIRNAVGKGGQQSLHRRLVRELDANDNTVTFDDAELGLLMRYMTAYGSGTFQTRLNRAFKRSLSDLLGW